MTIEEKNVTTEERVDCVLLYPPWTLVHERTLLTNGLPPLGILSIAGSLQEAGFKVKIIDIHAEKISPKEVEERLQQYKP